MNNNGRNIFLKKYNVIKNRITFDVILENNNIKENIICLWDTGAEICCISKRLIKKLNLQKRGSHTIHTPSGSKLVDIYSVNILLPNYVILKNHLVYESEIGDSGFDILIGMDIISKCDFTLSNKDQTIFSFRMPPKGNIELH